ncbi:MAG: hypothetical protein L3J62_03590 [Gammaproteobacteria bacterium]|nr:hypothetical protein [Gammaproteobacteria bacterium]MCF6229870.1 hypothetical protein [Gammaproteobacteria bacterium]
MFKSALITLVSTFFVLSLSGCTGTHVIEDSPILQPNLDQEYSTIYILRERPRYPTGFPDQPIKIDINGYDLGKLSYSEYIMLRIKPTEGTIRFLSLDLYGPIKEPRQLAGEETFNFAAGQTNFILAKFIDGEFRGAYFVPERIEFNRARKLAEKMKPYKIKKGQRITDL